MAELRAGGSQLRIHMERELYVQVFEELSYAVEKFLVGLISPGELELLSCQIRVRMEHGLQDIREMTAEPLPASNVRPPAPE